jgi:hypothetical protein
LGTAGHGDENSVCNKACFITVNPKSNFYYLFRNPGSFVTQQGNCTSAQLFSKLSRFNCKIGILAFFLEKCEMYEPLYLLKDRGTFFYLTE